MSNEYDNFNNYNRYNNPKSNGQQIKNESSNIDFEKFNQLYGQESYSNNTSYSAGAGQRNSSYTDSLYSNNSTYDEDGSQRNSTYTKDSYSKNTTYGTSSTQRFSGNYSGYDTSNAGYGGYQYMDRSNDKDRTSELPVIDSDSENIVNSESANKPVTKAQRTKSKTKPKAPKKEKGSRKIAKLIASALIFGIVAGTAFEGVHLIGNKFSGGSSTQAVNSGNNVEIASTANPGEVSTQSLSTGGSTTLNYDVADIAEKAQSSLVSITTTVTTTYQYFYQKYQEEQQGAGSGVIIGKDDNYLYIVTNYHVIQDANEINVGFCDGEVVKATVKGYDSDQDIAVVTVPFSDMKDSTANTITIAQIGDSDSLKVGEPVVAVGNALGYGQSVTVGYISALNRSIEGAEGTYIQTDAAINPGNSGGALLNAQGQLIGINSIKYVDSKVEGMGFSIPVNTAMTIVEDIISGTKEKPYIGISGVDISKEYSQIYGFPEGIYVKELTSNAPAEKAGIHAGDIIVEFNGQTVYTMEELQKAIANCNEGDEVKVVVYRQGSMGSYEKQEIELTIEKGFVG